GAPSILWATPPPRSRLTCASPSFQAPPPTELYTLSLHDALPIYGDHRRGRSGESGGAAAARPDPGADGGGQLRPRQPGDRLRRRSEEHTSELQSRENLVCRLLLEKKKYTSCVHYHLTRAPRVACE